MATEPIKLKNTIKKMLTKGLTASEKIELSEEKPVAHLLQKQWDSDSPTYIKDQVEATDIWNNIISICWSDHKKTYKYKRYLRIGYSVAAVFLLLIVSTWAIRYFNDSYITINNPVGHKVAIATLPDNSKIWLKEGASIRYKSRFAIDRTLKLTGEASFDVTKSTHPFRVYFQDACIEVKGTEFNIKSERNLAEITLYSGKIEFSSKTLQRTIEMKPSEQIIYNTSTHEIINNEFDLEDYDWRSEEYHFIDKPMSELIHLINNSYQAKIKLYDEKNARHLFSGTIRKNEPLQDVLNKICISFNLKSKTEKDSIILY